MVTVDENNQKLTDPYGRTVDYLRVSVTDRCDFRCQYCMSENMTFLPKKDLLSFEELAEICDMFVKLGTKKIRISGGEPLVRKNILNLLKQMGSWVEQGRLEELTLTTNGTQLKRFAQDLVSCNIKRINVSLDSLDPQKFQQITRWGKLEPVLDGIMAAKNLGIHVKINTVVMKDFNDQEIPNLIAWAHGHGFDISLIETMPMGEVEPDRVDQYQPLSEIRERLSSSWTLVPSNHRTAGPATYVDVLQTGGRLGFITPLSHNFCESCNRVRLTCTGLLYLCLGQDDCYDLRKTLRKQEDLEKAIRHALGMKPKGHDFVIDRTKGISGVHRHMSVTGG